MANEIIPERTGIEDDKKVKEWRKTFEENKHKYFYQALLIVIDIGCINMASLAALFVRFEFSVTAVDPAFLKSVLTYAPVNTLFTILIFAAFKLYSSLWQYAGWRELIKIFLACCVSGLLQLGVYMIFRLPVPRSYYCLSFAVMFCLVAFFRFAWRFLRWDRDHVPVYAERQNVMMIGAGNAGMLLLREIMTSAYLKKSYRVRCIIDDDPSKIGRYFRGIRVVGNRDTICDNVREYEIDQIIVAMPSQKPSQIREILEICQETGCKLKLLPGIYQLVNEEVTVSRLRDVEIEDLLGREPVQVDLDTIAGYVRGQRVLVTGGGGSIGSELCRQIAAHAPQLLIIVDIYENNAYDIEQELKRKYPKQPLAVLIASVRDEERINSIFETYRPQLVFHAAAHKHVPLMEGSPAEAIKNNVFGTRNVVRAADQWQVRRFVMISTDKAVNPTNIMGASKRICEMLIQTYSRMSKTEFVAVRFGNVLGSNGSVIPLFKKQIAEGGPVTVTHPDIIRYFMTISEAVSLVLQAGSYAKGGEIYVLDMGEPVKIADLAKNLIRLSGLRLNEDIRIVYTGLRPGEKLYEELLMAEEGMKETPNHLIHIGKPIEMNEEVFFEDLEELEKAAEHNSPDIYQIVRKIVPTYVRMTQ